MNCPYLIVPMLADLILFDRSSEIDETTGDLLQKIELTNAIKWVTIGGICDRFAAISTCSTDYFSSAKELAASPRWYPPR